MVLLYYTKMNFLENVRVYDFFANIGFLGRLFFERLVFFEKPENNRHQKPN
jgi:hypothetical protein